MADLQYFLGIGGEQQGPFSETQVLEKIRKKEIGSDCLVWFEGLSDWQPLSNVPLFQPALEHPPTAPSNESASAPEPTPSAKSVFRPEQEGAKKNYSGAISQPSENDEPVSTFSSGKAEPIFKREDSTFGGGFFYKYKPQITIVVVLIIIGGTGIGSKLLLNSMLESGQESAEAKAKRKRELEALAAGAKEQEIRTALSELLLKPNESIPILRRAAVERGKEPIGKEALDALVGHFGGHSPLEAGRILMECKQPLEALKYFRKDTSALADTEQALWAGFEVSTDANERKQLLLEDIKLLLGTLNQRPKAIERIQYFEKTFPTEIHPYAYYTKSVDEKLRDLFNRSSFRYLQSLLSYIDTELPHVNMASQPVVELKKLEDKHYRIVANYTGPITLNQDKIDKVHFEFWLQNDSWMLVDTTLTAEKQKWVRQEREKVKNQSSLANDMLAILESNFENQFPGTALHERVPASATKPNEFDETATKK